jgi:hypothetical protein
MDEFGDSREGVQGDILSYVQGADAKTLTALSRGDTSGMLRSIRDGYGEDKQGHFRTLDLVSQNKDFKQTIRGMAMARMRQGADQEALKWQRDRLTSYEESTRYGGSFGEIFGNYRGGSDIAKVLAGTMTSTGDFGDNQPGTDGAEAFQNAGRMMLTMDPSDLRKAASHTYMVAQRSKDPSMYHLHHMLKTSADFREVTDKHVKNPNSPKAKKKMAEFLLGGDATLMGLIEESGALKKGGFLDESTYRKIESELTQRYKAEYKEDGQMYAQQMMAALSENFGDGLTASDMSAKGKKGRDLMGAVQNRGAIQSAVGAMRDAQTETSGDRLGKVVESLVPAFEKLQTVISKIKSPAADE